MGASLFGYTKLYGQVPGGQAEYLRVPQAQFGPIKVPEGPADERFLYLSDVLPTAWQAVEYARIPEGGSVAVFGLGPIGQMAARIARYRGSRVIAVDSVPERNAMARRHGIEVVDSSAVDDVTTAIRDLTDGRGTDSAIDAVGHGGARRLGDPAARAEGGRQAPGRHRRAADAGGRRRPDRGARRVRRRRAPRRRRVAVRASTAGPPTRSTC